MPYYGYLSVELKLLRQGHGEDSSGQPGSGFGVEVERTLRIEEPRQDAEHEAALAKIGTAIRELLDEDVMHGLQERWQLATEKMSVKQMQDALAVLEGRG